MRNSITRISLLLSSSVTLTTEICAGREDLKRRKRQISSPLRFVRRQKQPLSSVPISAIHGQILPIRPEKILKHRGTEDTEKADGDEKHPSGGFIVPKNRQFFMRQYILIGFLLFLCVPRASVFPFFGVLN